MFIIFHGNIIDARLYYIYINYIYKKINNIQIQQNQDNNQNIQNLDTCRNILSRYFKMDLKEALIQQLANLLRENAAKTHSRNMLIKIKETDPYDALLSLFSFLNKKHIYQWITQAKREHLIFFLKKLE